MTGAPLIPPQLPSGLHLAAIRGAQWRPTRRAQSSGARRRRHQPQRTQGRWRGRVRLVPAVSLCAVPKRP
ncbi:hypothetical protein DB811_16295 [Xanthomonas perforans]|uniref:Uncharacterized protein n=1 Tax=Xanthomonas perforans TaxID=442694 RepID=A0AAQ0YNC0_XANPE|nr:hypothetical protein BJD13_23030 [Xanthomonas perforans]AQS78931.1 hypothetical protein XPE_18650 [Xanthomonas perforans 91-118]OQP43576.1 hypothetical protein IB62_000455 [Xanthomonas euvesicatoria]PWH24695.1 hypothetical protein CDO09_06715 [Xanthomonas perforans]RXD37844.1 hypothetical protein DB757_18330 [Xanthomonas perforans]